MKKFKRSKLFIDPRVQGAILARIVSYWVCCVLFITLPMLIMTVVSEPDLTFGAHLGVVWQSAGPLLTATVLLLPLAIYDVLKLTNKFAGPVYRFRRELSRMARGEEVQAIEFRGKDFWNDLADSYNLLLERLQSSDDVNERREQIASEDEDVESMATSAAE